MSTDLIPGPPLVVVVARLRSVPDELADPRLSLPALVADTADRLAPAADPWSEPAPNWQPPSDEVGAQAVAIGCWLVLDPPVTTCLRGSSDPVGRLHAGLAELVTLTADSPPAHWIGADPEREEEAVRALCRGLGVLFDGESEATAADRWAAVSTAARRQALRDAARAEELAQQLAAKAAAEAAARAAYV